MACPFAAVVVVGIPEPVLRAARGFIGRDVQLDGLVTDRRVGERLQLRPRAATQTLEQLADKHVDEHGRYDALEVVVLPYVRLPDEVENVIAILEEAGATVVRVRSNEGRFPASRKPDKGFQDELQGALQHLLAPPDEQHVHDVACELLRGLASHSKMGENNHSSEDDLWKSRGRNLQPGEKTLLVAELMNDGILSRKKNDSMGGKGWVYWISDFARAKVRCPRLADYE